MAARSAEIRIRIVAACFYALLAVVTVRLFHLQIVQHDRLSRLAQRQQERTLDVEPARGRIFDRAGRPLALNREVPSFFAVPSEIAQPAAAARRLAPFTRTSAAALEKRLRQNREFVWIRRKADDRTAATLRSLGLRGLHELNETQRVYPEGRLASHVLGFVGVDDQGLAGVELEQDRALRGTKGYLRISRDAQGRVVPLASKTTRAPEPGRDLTLTLDKVIQHTAERELAAVVEKYHAQGGSVVVLEPGSGEVLALANAPDYDPNRIQAFAAAARRNRAVQDVYEPGSTFKLVTAAAALGEKRFAEGDRLNCEMGRAKFFGRTVRDHLPHGVIPFHEVFAVSSNIGAVKVGMRVGAERLVAYARALGYGRPTHIELPGEAAGLLKDARRWTPATMAAFPFGQEVAVTTLQTALAYAVIANEGKYVPPRLIRDPAALDDPLRQPREVLPAETARRLKKILTEVVAGGTGTEAAVNPWVVAGKTGTAQKPSRTGRGYDPERYVASFVGFLPAEAPRLVIAVVIDEPRGIEWGGVVAGPAFKAIGQNVMAYLGVLPAGAVAQAAPTPGTSAMPRAAALITVPDLIGEDHAAAKACLLRQGLTTRTPPGPGRVLAQHPAAGARALPGTAVALTIGSAGRALAWADGPAEPAPIPNLTGQSMRNALDVLAAYGVTARVVGSGVVVAQAPSPQTLMRPGSVCVLTCKDPEALP